MLAGVQFRTDSEAFNKDLATCKVQSLLLSAIKKGVDSVQFNDTLLRQEYPDWLNMTVEIMSLLPMSRWVWSARLGESLLVSKHSLILSYEGGLIGIELKQVDSDG